MSDGPEHSLAQLTRYFLKLGGMDFGEPVALVGYMYGDLIVGWTAFPALHR